jgi:3-methyladenine DNA glycosylase AlkC
MDKLPEVCRDCAEYGSHFCEDCLDEINKNLSHEERLILNHALRNIAKKDETLGSTDTENGKE